MKPFTALLLGFEETGKASRPFTAGSEAKFPPKDVGLLRIGQRNETHFLHMNQNFLSFWILFFFPFLSFSFFFLAMKWGQEFNGENI